MARIGSNARFDDPIFSTVFSEKNTVFRRTDRIYSNDNDFYYSTREGDIRGPFSNKIEVKSDLEVFIHITDIEREFTQADMLKLA